MKQNIDYKNYRYFYDVGIIRMDRKTGKTERFLNGEFVETIFKTDIENRLNDGFDGISELREDSHREMEFLRKELGIIEKSMVSDTQNAASCKQPTDFDGKTKR